MKKQKSLYRSIFWVAVITLLILSVPLVAMRFTDEVNWSLTDFIIMGSLIFSTGLSYVMLTRSSSNTISRIAFAMAIASTFLIVWVNLAVGLIGSGPNAANLMYAGIVAIVIIGTFISRLTTKGMEWVMFTATIALVLFAAIQLLTKMNEYPGSSVTEIIAVNGFFAILFGISGLLFRYVTMKQLSTRNSS